MVLFSDGVTSLTLCAKTLQGLSVPFASGDPVRVLRLYTTNTLDTIEAFIAETYVQLAATGANVLRAQALCSETSD